MMKIALAVIGILVSTAAANADATLSVVWGLKDPITFAPSAMVGVPCNAPPGSVVATMPQQQSGKTVSYVVASDAIAAGEGAAPSTTGPSSSSLVVQGNQIVVGPNGPDQSHCGQMERVTVSATPLP